LFAQRTNYIMSSNDVLKDRLKIRDEMVIDIIKKGLIPRYSPEQFRTYLRIDGLSLDPNIHRRLSAAELAFLSTQEGKTVPEKLYILFYGKVLCKNCNKNTAAFHNFKKGYRQFCSQECSNSNKDKKLKIERAFETRYGEGIKNAQQVEAIKLRTLKTKIEKYGHPYYQGKDY